MRGNEREFEGPSLSKILTGFVVGTAMIGSLAAYSAAQGYSTAKGDPMIELGLLDKTLYGLTGTASVISMGQMIPFRFDNMDPGCMSTIIAIPLSVCLAKASYAFGYAYGVAH